MLAISKAFASMDFRSTWTCTLSRLISLQSQAIWAQLLWKHPALFSWLAVSPALPPQISLELHFHLLLLWRPVGWCRSLLPAAKFDTSGLRAVSFLLEIWAEHSTLLCWRGQACNYQQVQVIVMFTVLVTSPPKKKQNRAWYLQQNPIQISSPQRRKNNSCGPASLWALWALLAPVVWQETCQEWSSALRWCSNSLPWSPMRSSFLCLLNHL